MNILGSGTPVGDAELHELPCFWTNLSFFPAVQGAKAPSRATGFLNAGLVDTGGFEHVSSCFWIGLSTWRVPRSAIGRVVVGGRGGRGDLEVQVELRVKLRRVKPAKVGLNRPVFEGFRDRVDGNFQVRQDFLDDFEI